MKRTEIDPETNFLSGMMELHHGLPVKENLKEISKKISWAQGWPKKKESFWNAEAFMWNHKINSEKRKLIAEELAFLHGGKNLDLGCGSHSYLLSVGFDLSEKMLQFNDSCSEKVKGDLEQPLPFMENSFDSVTAIFVLNYVKNYLQLLEEIRRVIKEKGIFAVVIYARDLNDWQKQQEVNHFTERKWKAFLEKFFETNVYEKENLWFFVCKKAKNY